VKYDGLFLLGTTKVACLVQVGQELHIPKELWTLIDFLYRSGLQEVRIWFLLFARAAHDFVTHSLCHIYTPN